MPTRILSWAALMHCLVPWKSERQKMTDAWSSAHQAMYIKGIAVLVAAASCRIPSVTAPLGSYLGHR